MKTNEIITNQIIENLETAGEWVKNWQDLHNVNLISKRGYTGVNTLLLAQSRAKNGFTSPTWATYKQVTTKGGTVKKGSKSTMIIFCKSITYKKDVKDESEKGRTSFMLRYYRVFNLDQTEGVKVDKVELQGEGNETIKQPADLIADYLKRESIELLEGLGNRASYNPAKDVINMPSFKAFDTSDNYYKVLFHESTHSTGHKNRLNRFDGQSIHNNKQEYSREELTAELGSLFLSAHVGIKQNIENSQAYIKGWIKALKNDPQMVITASSKAQKAFDYITNK